ncbi:hypothetical protein KIN20_024418 [Parelaphostrongylus tenuis]|uniref:Uncharacterized protein n=1 Tax=Parelaphostrongylus tenuis TaxID=148309 RepID=A0AAD5MTH0_PARTN|nr:hypothetical protein KIN20_024418 [Parelaphostrongylus tenuis]
MKSHRLGIHVGGSGLPPSLRRHIKFYLVDAIRFLELLMLRGYDKQCHKIRDHHQLPSDHLETWQK